MPKLNPEKPQTIIYKLRQLGFEGSKANLPSPTPWLSDQRTPLRWIGAPMRRNGWIIAGSIVGAGDAILQETPDRRVLLDYSSRSGSKPASIGGVSEVCMVDQR